MNNTNILFNFIIILYILLVITRKPNKIILLFSIIALIFHCISIFDLINNTKNDPQSIGGISIFLVNIIITFTILITALCYHKNDYIILFFAFFTYLTKLYPNDGFSLKYEMSIASISAAAAGATFILYK
tara:strand:+ start:574 stop:963 length:390 start_codon:yes stop_codon:yes gene_type:complete